MPVQTTSAHTLAAAIAKDVNLPVAKVKAVLDSAYEFVVGDVKAGRKVVLGKFGRFIKQRRAAREGRNPATGETIHIKAKTVVKFSMAKALKDDVA